MSFKFPIKKISEVCENLDSKRIPITQNKRTAGEIPYFGASGIVDYVKDYIFDEELLLVSEDGANLLARTYPIAFSIKGKTWVNNHAHVLKFKEFTSQKFIEYYLNSIKLDSYVSGMAQPKLNQKSLNSIQVPFPDIETQKQIVTILDKAFAAIDQAKANIERNIENAKELFQSKLNEIFSQKGEGWEEKKLGEITTKIGSGSTPRGGQASYKESGISLIRSMNVHDDGFRERNLAFIDEEQAGKLNNVRIEEDDVLLNITGASVARCCIVDKDYLPARVNQHVSIIRLKDGILNPDFLHYALTSKQTKDKLLGIGEQGSTRQAITKVQIENFSIKFPIDIKKQKALVNALNEIRNNSEKLVHSYKLKILSLEELKKSILQKAFTGELTEKEVAA